MTIGDLIKKTPFYLLIVLLIIFFPCTSNSGRTPDQDKSEQNFQIPKLVQQEISAEESGDREEYSFYNSIRENGPVIPGIFQAAVPQGMAYYSDEDIMLISNYMFDGRPSCITAVSMSDGLLTKILWLLNPDGSPHKGHVGGLAVSKKHLWIASGKGVYYISLEIFSSQQDNSNLTMTAFAPTAAKGSFATFADGILWIGEFTSRDGSYSVPDSHHFRTTDAAMNHGWLAGFILDSVLDMINPDHKISDVSYPDYILSIPDEVQGAAFIRDKIILSQSYGRNNDSRISIYQNPMNETSINDATLDNGRSIPVWILEKENLEREIMAPPMTEGIVEYKGSAAVLYESGSDKYRNSAKNPQGRIHILTLIADD